MHRRWMSLPLLSSCVSAFYPYHGLDISVDLGDNSKRFVPYHQAVDVDQDGLVKLDLKKVYKRNNQFAVVLSNDPTAPNALAISQDGADFSYFSTMKFGSKDQNMFMLIDTGSANTWVFGESCTSKSCSVHNLFGPSDSTTLQSSSNKWSLTYGTGTVSGVVATDNVSFANFTVNMGFGLASTASDDFLSYPMDGILGLGRAPTNELNTPTAMEVLDTQGKLAAKVVGIHLNRAADNTKDGEIIFGGIDYSKVTGSISYTATSNANSWEIPVDDAYVSGTAVGFTGKKAIIDTGTSYILMPPSDAQALHKLIPKSSQSGENFIIPCDTSVTIQFSFSGAKWSVSPKDYVGKSAPSGNGCTSNIVGHQAYGADEWILGDVFLKNVYAVFDYDNSQIGFGAPATGSSGTSTPTSSGTSSASASASGMTTSIVPSSSGSSTSGSATTSATPAMMTATPFDGTTGGSSSNSSNSGSSSGSNNSNSDSTTKKNSAQSSRNIGNTLFSIPCVMAVAFLFGILV